MELGIQVRPAVEQDAPAMARVHVESWRETYRGLMSDAVLDDPDFIARREKFWTAALTDPRYAAQQVAIAERDSLLIGIAMAGPAQEPAVDWSAQLYLLYTYTAVHGLGAGAALLDAVIEPTSVVGLWVADPNPRAQAFYRKHGFLQMAQIGRKTESTRYEWFDADKPAPLCHSEIRLQDAPAARLRAQSLDALRAPEQAPNCELHRPPRTTRGCSATRLTTSRRGSVMGAGKYTAQTPVAGSGCRIAARPGPARWCY